MRHNRLHEHRQDGEEGQADGHRDQVPGEVLPGVVGGEMLDRLGDEGEADADPQHDREHRADHQHLGDDEGPVRGRGGVDDLLGLAVAFAPDQFAGVVDADDERHEGEAAGEHLDHRAGDRIEGDPVDAVEEEQRPAGVEQAQHQQHQEGRALEHQAEVHPHAGHELRPGGAAAEAGRRGGRVGQGRTFGFGRARGLFAAGFRAAHLEVKQAVGQGEEGEADPGPDQPVVEQRPDQGRQGAVAVGGGEVAGGELEGAEAERLHIGDRHHVLGLGGDGGGHGVEDQEGDQAHIGGHHRPGDRRQSEEAGGGQEQGRRGDHPEGEKIVPGPEWPELGRVDPGHHRAQEDRRRHRQEGDHRGQEGAGEAPEQVVGLGDPGRLDQRPEPGLVVAHHHIGHEGGGDEHEEQGQDQVGLDDGVGPVEVAVGAIADVDVVDGDGGEGEQEEGDHRHPEHRVLQLVAQLEGRDLGEHGLAPPRPDQAARRVACRVAK